MPSMYKIQSAATGESEDWYGARGFYYRVADHQVFTVKTEMRWCDSCQRFIDAEALPSMEDCERQLRFISDHDTQRNHLAAISRHLSIAEEELNIDYDSLVAEAALWIELITHRRSPCRCLYCGSTALIDEKQDDGVSVPGHGQFQIKWVGMCSTDFLNWHYTCEGVRIDDESVPASSA